MQRDEDLKNNFSDFVKNKKPQNNESNTLKDKLSKFMLHNKKEINLFKNVLNTVSSFNLNKTPVVLLHGGLTSISDYLNMGEWDFYTDVYNESNGWTITSSNELSYFQEELESLPYKIIPFKDNYYVVKEYSLNNSKFLCVDSKRREKRCVIITKENQYLKYTDVLEQLANIKLKKYNTNSFSVKKEVIDGSESITLVADQNYKIDSELSDILTKNIKKYHDLNINRSLILKGLPGTGKTILSQSVVNNLNLRLLKIKGNFEITEIINLIKLFKIEAVILDDFEYNDKTDTFLELLEVLNKNIKLTIAILNNDESLSPALLRPGRFDEIIEISSLSEDAVKSILTDKTMKYFDDVKDWGIAFINEFVKRSKVLSDEELEESLKELNDRFEQQKSQDADIEDEENNNDEKKNLLKKLNIKKKLNS